MFANIGLLDKIWNWPVTVVVVLQFIWWCFVRDYRKSVKCLSGEMILLWGFTHNHPCMQMFQKQRETVYWSLASTAATVALTQISWRQLRHFFSATRSNLIIQTWYKYFFFIQWQWTINGRYCIQVLLIADSAYFLMMLICQDVKKVSCLDFFFLQGEGTVSDFKTSALDHPCLVNAHACHIPSLQSLKFWDSKPDFRHRAV